MKIETETIIFSSPTPTNKRINIEALERDSKKKCLGLFFINEFILIVEIFIKIIKINLQNHLFQLQKTKPKNSPRFVIFIFNFQLKIYKFVNNKFIFKKDFVELE